MERNKHKTENLHIFVISCEKGPEIWNINSNIVLCIVSCKKTVFFDFKKRRYCETFRKSVHLEILSIKGLNKLVPKIYAFSQLVLSHCSVHFSDILLHPQFFVHIFLQWHLVVKSDSTGEKLSPGFNGPFLMIHP